MFTIKSSPLSLNSQKLSVILALLSRIDLISVPVKTKQYYEFFHLKLLYNKITIKKCLIACGKI